MGYMNLFADEVHNLIDEMIIGASYTVSLHVGFAPTMAVIFREIPHELGNFFVLLYAGFAKEGVVLILCQRCRLGTMISC
jgi:zinc transporter ZupT